MNRQAFVKCYWIEELNDLDTLRVQDGASLMIVGR